MSNKYQEGYREGLKTEGTPLPGQSLRRFIDETLSGLEPATHPEFWDDVADTPDYAISQSEWYKGYMAGITSRFAAALKQEEMYKAGR